MISFAGLVLMVLGVASGLVLVLAPFQVGPAVPGITTWILFPGFTLVGYILFAVEAGTSGSSERRAMPVRPCWPWRWSPRSPCLRWATG